MLGSSTFFISATAAVRSTGIYLPKAFFPRLFNSSSALLYANTNLSTPPTKKISSSKKSDQSKRTSGEKPGSKGSSSGRGSSHIPSSVYYNAATKTFFPSQPIRPITPSYEDKANEEPVTLTEPQKLLVILDLNGTLFYRSKGNNRSIIPRPHLSQFLDFLFKHCQVMVWSSAQPQSVEAMLDHGFGNYSTRLDRVWNRTHFRLTSDDYAKKVLTIKDLEFVWEGIKKEQKAASNTEGKNEKYLIEFDQTNTVLIDDSKDKIQLQPHNGLALRDFVVDLAKSGTDDELPKVMKYLEKLTYQKNVSAYMRLHPYDSDKQISQGVAEDTEKVEKVKKVETVELNDVMDDLISRFEQNAV
ncbi:hypothetical protein BGZ49_008007 [Haplosporangium sp. Z 27]|nr:hypothetical protein BGZ49_008007 [Haplosporangium sp. Z 27]